MRDISVVIPARNEHPQATFTLQRIWDELEGSGLDWETIIVDNLSDDRTSSFCKDRYWHVEGRHKIVHYDDSASCWGARNAGVAQAEGRLVFLFDAHVLVSTHLLLLHFAAMEDHPSATILYSPVIWMGDSKKHTCYGYSLGENCEHLYRKFWGSWTRQKRSDSPYRIPMSGTAGVCIRREFLERVGGWPEELRVYGGGEQWISLLCWMLGGECWVHPGTYLYHLADRRGYSDGTNETHFFNKCLVAYALGGEKWLNVVVGRRMATSSLCYHPAFYKLAEEAKAAGQKYREWVDANKVYTLDEVLERQPWDGQAALPQTETSPTWAT